MTSLLLVVLLCGAGRATAQEREDVIPEGDQLVHYIRDQINANEARLSKSAGASQQPVYAGLPDTLSATLPEDDGFVSDQRVSGEELVADVEGLKRAGLDVGSAFEDEEWARLPDGAVIRRDFSRGYTIWRYPAGTRLAHRIFLKSNHQLVELRLEKKLEDDSPGRTGAWAFGIYRPVDTSGQLRLYKPGADQPQESVRLSAPNGLGHLTWKRISYDRCRFCHIAMGPGWYQYSDEAHAGPCGFVPANKSLLADWAPRYRQKHGTFPFIVGP
jgi:hypothetical protein